MKTYIYKIDFLKTYKTGGSDFKISVYRIKNNLPLFIGSKVIFSGSYHGDIATAKQIISKETGKKMLDNYNFKNENDIKIIRV